LPTYKVSDWVPQSTRFFKNSPEGYEAQLQAAIDLDVFIPEPEKAEELRHSSKILADNRDLLLGRDVA